MATPTTIPVTPGAGLLLDAVSLTVGLNTAVRETMVIADPSNAAQLATVNASNELNVSDATLEACITANVLAVSLPAAQIITLTPPTAASIGTSVSGDLLIGTQAAGSSVPVALPTATITTLTPPSAAAVAAAIVANPPTVTATISGTVAATQSGTWTVGIAAAQTIAVTNAGTFAVQSASTDNLTEVGGSAFALGQQLAASSLPVVLTAAQITTLTPLTSVAVTNIGTFAVQATLSAETTKVIGTINQGTSPWVVSNGGTFAVQASIAAAQKIEIYDGTNTATVKPASIAAVAADTSVVVATPGSTTAGACANTSVTSTSSAALAANTARREAIVINTDVVPVYLGLGQTPTATAYHVVLRPCTVAHDGTGGSFVTDKWQGAINAITASTSGHVSVTEMT